MEQEHHDSPRRLTQTVTQRDALPAVPPTSIGPYEVVSLLGRGGMGKVYLVRRQSPGGISRLFALKVMHERLASVPGGIELLFEEARLATHLHHPNTVPIHELGQDGDLHYLVMQYVEGAPLRTLLRSKQSWNRSGLVVPVVLDTLQGLHAAHSLCGMDGSPLHLVHRDVSPHNILVGVDGIARLADFGVAKASGSITNPRQGTRMGKPGYMAPEQIDSADNVDARADVFAMGVVLWTALTGESLFHGDSPEATIELVCNREVPRPSSVGMQPHPAFDEVCLKALARDPAQRFNSAEAFADALREVAIESDNLGSPKQVGQWVTDTCESELHARRALIAELELATNRDPSGAQVLLSPAEALANLDHGKRAGRSGLEEERLHETGSFSASYTATGQHSLVTPGRHDFERSSLGLIAPLDDGHPLPRTLKSRSGQTTRWLGWLGSALLVSLIVWKIVASDSTEDADVTVRKAKGETEDVLEIDALEKEIDETLASENEHSQTSSAPSQTTQERSDTVGDATAQAQPSRKVRRPQKRNGRALARTRRARRARLERQQRARDTASERDAQSAVSPNARSPMDERQPTQATNPGGESSSRQLQGLQPMLERNPYLHAQ